ncbi:undecaprenyl-phosphate glucose phosphotransferase [Aliikangiella marina]|uniref:Undecaprenyl-phosphate glucose phosphotransferase n=1 Tax=Aliikangiella marina TaxID=1712262 RepID=A0A545TBK7_9GAMM|nr:undecaprenyl-phosphate glucose phosphotransferase [Aliikangiella marina]TQV74584.1 undecaprenyl-phosphate glucose phosphotransferase [Aliikangiella marina]
MVVKKSNTFKTSGNTYSFILRLVDLGVMFVSLYLAMTIYNAIFTEDSYQVTFSQDYQVASLVVAVFFLYTAEMLNLYRSWRGSRFSQMIFTSWACIILSFVGFLLTAFLFKQSEDFSRVTLAIWGTSAMFLTFFWRAIYSGYRRLKLEAGHNLKKVAILGVNQLGLDLHTQIKTQKDLGFKFMGFYDDRDSERVMEEYGKTTEGRIDDVVTIAKNGTIDTLFIVLPLKAEARIAEILALLGDTTVDVHLVPDFLLANLVHSRINHVGDMDTLSVFESPYYGAKVWVKRTEDIFISFGILLMIAIPMLLISLAVKITSRGPVFFKQPRYGLDGEEILVWKFRSMKVSNENAREKVVQAQKNDSRLTPIGGFLRKTSLDELPQFFNVLAGSMSIVGPRPHAVSHNEEYRQKVSFYMLRHKVKPGITGWAQINGWRGETDTLEKMEKRVQYDLEYIKNWSLWLDIRIIFMTVFKGFVGKNAY